MNIKNEADKVVIELFGAIGEGWFDEGITMESVNRQLKEAKGKPIDVLISSLGGDVNHAFAIHDLLKMHDKPVTSKIIGLTASSGTLVAMGAGTVEMSDNALFLVHPAHIMTAGNANDLREGAKLLDTIDGRIVNIYKNKTGKRKSQIYSLMEEEKFIDAEAAKDFGFVNNIFTPDKVVNKVTEEEKQNILNKIKLVMNKEFTEINNVLKVEGLVIDEKEGTYLQKDQIESINNALTIDHTEAVATAVNDLEETHNTAITEKQTEIDNLASDKVTEKTATDKVAADLAKETVDLQKKFDTLESTYNQLKAKGMNLNSSEPGLGNEKLTDREKKHKANARKMSENIAKFEGEHVGNRKPRNKKADQKDD